MAGATDTARFFLEQSIPETRALERKGLFTTAELAAIVKKRSDFEHRVNGHAAQPAGFARYAEFEMNLEFLRQKRSQRIGSSESHNAWQRRAMGILGRATRRFPQDLSLWTQYAELARKQNAFKQLSKILTSMVRLHPTNPDAWIYAATYAMGELGDMTKARSYMQRGLRFCKDSPHFWVEFARLEMSYLAKVFARRAILGVDDAPRREEQSAEANDTDADVIALPVVTAEELEPTSGALSERSSEALKDPRSTPALSGAIPMAIFDAAMQHFKDEELGEKFFDLFATFTSVPCSDRILLHVVDLLRSAYPDSTSTLSVGLRRPLVGLDIATPQFARVLADALQQLHHLLKKRPSAELSLKSFGWITSYLQEDLDVDIRFVLLATSQKLLKLVAAAGSEDQSSADRVMPMIENIRRSGHVDTANDLTAEALVLLPEKSRSIQRCGVPASV